MARICVLTHTFPKNKNDTTAAFMHPLVLGLQKAGNQVVVLTPFHPQIQTKDFPYRIVSYRYIWPDFLHLLGYSRTLQSGNKLKPETYLLAPFLCFFGFLALLRLCRKEKIDYISSHWILPNGFLAFLVSKIQNIPYTITLPGSDIFLAKKNSLFTKMAIMCANQAMVVCADSPQFLADLKSLGAKIKKEEIIPYPVDIEKLRPVNSGQKKLRHALKINRDDLVIMSVARLVEKKGLDYLLKAAAPLLKKDKKLKMIIVGDGDWRERLKKLASELAINRQTIFEYRVPREEMIFYYNLADVFAITSIRDKQGNLDDSPVALFEAMACGKPVVATDFPGIAKVVKNNINGFLVEEKNITAIRGALKKILQSVNLRKKMGRASRLIAQEKLSLENIGNRYNQFFKGYSDPTKLYWEERAKNLKFKKESVLFLDLPHFNNYLHRLQLQELKEIIPQKKCLCLDFGCGYGRIAQKIAFFRPESFIYGIDFVQTYVDFFNQKLKKRGKAKLGDIRHLPFAKESFDLVWSLTTLSFLKEAADRQQAIGEIFRVLKPNGKAIIFESNKLGSKIATLWGLLPFLSRIMKKVKKENSIASYSFSEGEIDRLAVKNGGKIIKQKGYPFLTLFFPLTATLEKFFPFLVNHLFVIIEKLDKKFARSKFSYWIFYLVEKK